MINQQLIQQKQSESLNSQQNRLKRALDEIAQIKVVTPQKLSSQKVEERHLKTNTSTRFLNFDLCDNKSINKYTGCNCSKSLCLKMYCACFSVGRMCDETCLCQSCKNQTDNMQRSEAINQIIVKDPYAFSRKLPTSKFTDYMCNCKKSNCLKKYCDCFRKGKSCGKNCNCTGCHNHDQDNPDEPKLNKIVKLQ